MPAGLNFGLGSLPLLTDAETRSVSPENPMGKKGQGGMAAPPEKNSKAKLPANAHAADELGVGWKVRPFARCNAHRTITLMDVDGPGIIQHIWLVEDLNRGHVLRFYWDGEKEPSIEVPALEFFAVGHGKFAPVNSIAVVLNPKNAMNCYWPMPFRQHAKITLSNESDKDTELIAYQITYAETPVAENAGYFHAQWRHANTAVQNPYVILDDVKGKGRYVGTFFAWRQNSTRWGGEGEAKFFIDGDKRFPTICGTGTEDYFEFSYGFPGGAPPTGGLYTGCEAIGDGKLGPPSFYSLYRWHILDPINFHKDLKVTIQALGWNDGGQYAKQADDITSVAYWYQCEPHAPMLKLPPVKDRLK